MHLLYIDPGSSSMLIQLIAASIAGIAIFFKRIKLFIKSIFSKKDKDPIE
jgi:hypothetical protein